MREIDTETPVIWPSWCYSGDTASVENQLNKTELINNNNTNSNKVRTKRKGQPINSNNKITNNNNSINSLENLLNDRLMATAMAIASTSVAGTDSLNSLVGTGKKNLSSTTTDMIMSGNSNGLTMGLNNLIFNSIKNESIETNENLFPFTGSSSSTDCNTNSIKNERLSPVLNQQNGDLQSTHNTRSRSSTPSNIGSPQSQSSQQQTNLLNSSATLLYRQQEIPVRNCSDLIRNLAAKYNNGNPNDHSTSRPFPFNGNTSIQKIAKEQSVSPPDSKPSTGSSPATTTNLMAGLFPALQLPSTTLFGEYTDMRGTQALIQLARTVKLNNNGKDNVKGIKRPYASPSSTPSTSSSNNSRLPTIPFGLQNPFMGILRPGGGGGGQMTSTPKVQSRVKTDEPVGAPLDLSSSTPPAVKRSKTEVSPRSQYSSTEGSPFNQDLLEHSTITGPSKSDGGHKRCQAQSEEISSWTVNQVCDFVKEIDICAEYVENFREQSIDGTCLPLLTEEHLTNTLGMKLGPALKLRSRLAKKLGGPCPCVTCISSSSSSIPNGSVASPATSATTPRPASTDSNCI